MELVRIQKHLSEKGFCSRREAETLIKEGRISLNGEVVREMGVKIDPSKDIVIILPARTKGVNEKMSIVVNKPHGIVSSRERREGKTIFELLPQFEHLNVIGRLDKASEGLLLLSNDGVLARVVTGEDHTIEKEYEVEVRERLAPTKLRAFENGMILEDGPTLPAHAEALGTHTFAITLREGRKHQIRRMCDKVHLTIISLRRIRIGHIHIEKLAPGAFRILTASEVSSLKSLKKK